MREIINRIKQHALFFYGYLLLVATAIVLLISYGKGGSFLLLNGFHLDWADVFFINFTFLGDGNFTLILVIVYFFWFKKRKQSLTLLLGFLSSGLVAQIIKHLVVSPRPREFFKPAHFDFFIDSNILSGNSSTPSGHTATAFATAAILVLLSGSKKWQGPILILATLVAYSRVYLAQHFLFDVLLGSFIGISCGVACVYATRKLDENKLLFKNRQSKNGKPKEDFQKTE